jgi:membrane protease YdiL (CAAX protease family)
MRKSRPADVVGLCTGMAVESVVYALALCGLSRGLAALIESLSVYLAAGSSSETTLQQIITYVGAGVYEEVLFRLVLFTLLLWICAHCRLPARLCIFSAALGSAVLFAAAHHFGSHGEQFDAYAFGFRSLAGVYFAYLYYYRGFGVAAGTHAVYDVVVGILAM